MLKVDNGKNVKCIDPIGEEIFESWLEMNDLKFHLLQEDNTQVFARDNFLSLLKKTLEYFQQLNNINVLSTYSQDSISLSSCLRIIDIMYQYSSDKVALSNCDYNDFEDLENFPLSKRQISLKSSQLLAQSLCFGVSIISRKRLGNIISVIYNGKTICYDTNKGNFEDVMKEVCEYPFSQY